MSKQSAKPAVINVLGCQKVGCILRVLQSVAVCCSVYHGSKESEDPAAQVWSGVKKATNVLECQKVGCILCVSQCCSVLVPWVEGVGRACSDKCIRMTESRRYSTCVAVYCSVL